VHGNFIIIQSLPTTSANISNSFINNVIEYVDETGPGWVTALPTWLIGDEVRFYSRITLQAIGGMNVITSATASTVQFRDPLPAGVRRYDMFLSLRRVASVDIRRSFFGNSNSRGLLISAVDTVLLDNTFANLTQAAVDFFEGGCGAVGGQADYTEGAACLS
jgi:hypothetical protein